MARHTQGVHYYFLATVEILDPLKINKFNNSQDPPLTGDSHSSLGFGGGAPSNEHLGPESSEETLSPRVTGVLPFLNHRGLFTSSADAVIITLRPLLS